MIINLLRRMLQALASIPTRIFGSRNQRLIKQYSQVVEQINALESGLAKLPDPELQAKTEELKKRHKEGATLDQLLPEAFAVVREASKRVLGSSFQLPPRRAVCSSRRRRWARAAWRVVRSRSRWSFLV